jgi:hypothetical protein
LAEIRHGAAVSSIFSWTIIYCLLDVDDLNNINVVESEGSVDKAEIPDESCPVFSCIIRCAFFFFPALYFIF